jgi:hypothetical protein
MFASRYQTAHDQVAHLPALGNHQTWNYAEREIADEMRNDQWDQTILVVIYEFCPSAP